MDGDQSILKKKKMDNQSVDDLLSDLPLSVIHCILAHLPIQDAVRTCVLSSKWRYKWASLPHLVFDDKCVDTKGKLVGPWSDCVKKFITSVLFLHKGPIHKFRLSVNFMSTCPDIDQWLIHLSRNEIREIFVELRYYWPLLVHSCLYSCEKLTHLEFYDCKLRPPPPSFKGFSFLRSLALCRSEVPSSTLEILVAKSPLLEKFAYDTPEWSKGSESELRISAPKLTYFHLTGSFEGISLYAPLVAEVFVSWNVIQQKKSPVCNYAKFFGGCTNLERLTAKGFFTEYLSIGIESYDHSLVFHHLHSIELCEVSFEDKKQLAVVGHLIMGTPNLQELKISSCTEDASGSPPNCFSDFGWPPNFTIKKLRVVDIKHVCGLLYEMEFIKHLLKSSPVLETMNLYYRSELLSRARLNLATKVVRYRRASPDAEIFLL